MSRQQYPRGLAHVGLTVPDIDEAIDWYTTVLGFSHVRGPETVVADEGYAGRRRRTSSETSRRCNWPTSRRGIKSASNSSSSSRLRATRTRIRRTRVCSTSA
ncbi:VOC family protein [Halogeometricum sp. CBA1124]|uniref:VOC family protein n=1 Tax=Halogeometricum sp. CBA1124 TaxID=2668071 RepID=UPI0037429C58